MPGERERLGQLRLLTGCERQVGEQQFSPQLHARPAVQQAVVVQLDDQLHIVGEPVKQEPDQRGSVDLEAAPSLLVQLGEDLSLLLLGRRSA